MISDTTIEVSINVEIRHRTGLGDVTEVRDAVKATLPEVSSLADELTTAQAAIATAVQRVTARLTAVEGDEKR